MALNTAARVWSPYKELHHTIESAIVRKSADAIQDLEVILRKHKPDFISLLSTPAKNPVHRDVVKKAHTDGLPIQGQQGTQLLSKQFIEEALTLSDLFNLNEYAAVELLLAGESQQSYFPGLVRGLVAVLLFYDGRASLVNSLKMLLQAREGRTWSLGLGEDLSAQVTKFTDQVMKEGLCNHIIDLLGKIDVIKEEEKLQKPEYRALGPPNHRSQVISKMKEIRQSLADCLFAWSCQWPLPRADILRLLAYLRTCTSSRADGVLDDVNLTLLMVALYSLDVRILEQEDSEDVSKMPVIADSQFVPHVHKEMLSSPKWEIKGLKAVVQLAWSQTLRALSQYSGTPGLSEYCEQDEALLDVAVEENVFFFIQSAVIANEQFHKQEFYLRQLHNLITDFIVQMPLKVKELRNRGDETARIIVANQQEGLEPPHGIRRDFEHMMRMLAELYGKDPLSLELCVEFWCPAESLQNSIGHSSMTTMYNYRPPQRQISLYKFLRLAGDLLPPPLFIPYLNMMAGLANGPQCAHHCFTLLKTNGLTGGGQMSTVSWDHFFMSLNQYYANLRQEAPSMSDLQHVYRHHLRGITPQELSGLVAVMNLIKVVAEHDENGRIAICENQQWLPLVVLLGLISCSIPPQLKAESMLTLAAFAKTPEIAANLWQNIEVSQILPTVSSTQIHKAVGIHVELDEVEARNEEFPMTRAFLALINTLTDNPIPASLGIGYRAPGFQPYLDFLRDSVFLKFNTRAYKNAAEKWQVGSAVLEIMHKLLANHDIGLDDFVDHHVEVQGEGPGVVQKPPGHTLMIHMLNDTSMLKMILYIIDEATKQFDKCTPFPGKEHLEKASLLCMKMLEVTLEKQSTFLDGVRESGAAITVFQLDKLLLGINPRSGRADHLANISRYVTYHSTLPEHSLSAVKVLLWVNQSAHVQPKIVGLFTATENTKRDLLHGFVECLEAENPEDVDQSQEDEDEEGTQAQVANGTRHNIMRLVLQTLDHPAPNLAHFLLGFEIRKPVSKTNLQDPGVLESPRTCLHAILSILNRGVETRSGPACLQETPRLAELAYHVIYVLCANKDTSGPIMRYLRTHDFLYRHIQHVPFQLQEGGTSSMIENMLLAQQSWLLKALAIELRLTSANRQRSHTQRLMNVLLDDTPTISEKVLRADGTFEPDYSQYDIEYTMYSGGQPHFQQTISGGHARRKLLSVLDSIEFNQDFPNPPALESFNPALIEQVIQSCESRNEWGTQVCDVKLLHKILTNELNNLQGTVSGQRPLIMQEIQAICGSVVERNAYKEAIHAKRQAFDAWRHVVEIILTACPEDLLHGEPRQNVLFEVLQDLLLKVSKEDTVSELTSPVAGVILTLMANLRQCFFNDPSDLGKSHSNTRFMSMLDDGVNMGTQPTGFGSVSGARTLFASSLQVVLKGLIEHMMRSSSGPQRVRAYLYGALLYYLQIGQRSPTPTQYEPGTNEQGVGSKIAAKENELERLTRENLDTISRYGENFMEVVCRDACDGHDVGRMLALATLDLMLSMDHHQHWLSHLTSKGYLQHIVESFIQDDQHLQLMLQPHPEPLKALYIFESKVGMVTRVAESTVGAHTLLQCGITTRLAECSIFDLRPETDSHTEGFIPSVLSRYRQHILFPVLKLCTAILTSMGVENRQACNQVLRFIVSHAEVFNTIMRDRQSTLNVESLQELALVTAVISKAAIDDGGDTFLDGDTANIEFRGLLSRLQRQMISLLPKYCLTEKLQKQLKNVETGMSGTEASDIRARMQLAAEEIASNVVAFCRTIICKSGTNPKLFRILFGPSLVDAMSRDMLGMEDMQGYVPNATRPQNLGVIVYMLTQSTNQFLATFDSHKQLMRKYNNITELSGEELKELCGSTPNEKTSAQQRQLIARRRLAEILSYKNQDLQLFSYIIENCMFILWRHLEFYLVHCVPADQSTTLFKTHAGKQHMRKLQDPLDDSSPFLSEEDTFELGQTVGVSREQLEQLKTDCHACLSESLFKKLQEIEQCYTKGRTRYGFVDAMVRRLKRLLLLHTGKS